MLRKGKRIGAALLAVVLLVGQLGATAYAEGPPSDAGGLCEHHAAHDDTCGYVETIPGRDCEHEHTPECYTHELICGLDEDAEQTATDSDAGHRHGQECYGLDCPHERGEHDEACGYAEAVPGTPCGYVCEVCGKEPDKDSGTPGGNTPAPVEPELGTGEPEDAGTITVTAFDGLDEAVEYQTVPAGTTLDDLTLPATLGASGYVVSDDTAPEPEAIAITSVTWGPDSPWDDTAEQGGYIFTPVLPASYTLADGVELPEIEVWYGFAYRADIRDYDADDVAAIHKMIDNNGLSAAKDNPAGWNFVTWDTSSPQRITNLSLANKGLTGTLDVGNLTNLTVLNCENNQLSELKGLDKLMKLKTLYCSNNRLMGTLDVENLSALTQLECQKNQLTSLNLTGLSTLNRLSCDDNQLTELNLTGLSALSNITCGNNPCTSFTTRDGYTLTISSAPGGTVWLKSFNLNKNYVDLTAKSSENYAFQKWIATGATLPNETGNPGRVPLGSNVNITPVFMATKGYNADDMAVVNVMYDKNGLKTGTKDDPATWSFVTWDTSDFKRIVGLTLVNKDLTGVLDVSGLTELTSLSCSNNQLTELKGLDNLTKLVTLSCYDNQLTELNLTGLTALDYLNCSKNQLTALDVSGLTKLDFLNCFNNQLMELKGLDKLTNLTHLDCGINDMETLNLSGLTGLTYLSCASNQLMTLDVSNLAQLTHLDCIYNQLETLDVENLTNLQVWACFGNRLTELNGLNKLTALINLNCSDNQLKVLDLSGLTALDVINCSDNPYTSFTTKNGHTLTVTPATGGKIWLTGFDKGSSEVELTAKPDSGHAFQVWTGLPVGAPNSQTTSFTLTGDATVEAAFIGMDATLKSLTLSGVALNPIFDPAATDYTASVGNSVSSVTITAEASDLKATVAGDGTKPLAEGANTFTITVTAEDGTTAKSYTITITRAAAASGGGGGGNGGTSRHYIITSPEPPKPNNPVLAVIELPVTVGNGTATGKPDDGRTASAIAEAGRDAKAKTNGIAVQYDAKTSTAYDGFSISLQRATLDRLIAAKVKYVTLNTGIVDLTFDLAALKEIAAKSTGDITLTAARETGLAVDALAAVGKRPAYRLSVIYTGKDGKAATVDSFGAGRVTVGLAYAPAATEQAGSLCLVYSKDGKGVEWLYSSYDRTSGNVIASVGHFSVYAVGHRPAPAFTDTVNHWAKPDIDFVASRGLLTGTGETTFSPDSTITRGMFVTALGRLAGVNPAAYPSSSRYTDVATTAYYAPYVEWAASKGIVNGTGEKSFSPDAAITREQMAAIMQRYADKLGYTLPVAREAEIFADEGPITGGMKNAVQAIQQAGIMNGKGGHRFGPGDTATRAEAAAVLRRFAEVIIDRATAGGWGQNDAGKWLYYEDAKPVTGWKQIDSKWYYFDSSGLMQAGGWREIGGKWYYFFPDGAMAVSTEIDGYEIGPDGVRKEKQ